MAWLSRYLGTQVCWPFVLWIKRILDCVDRLTPIHTALCSAVSEVRESYFCLSLSLFPSVLKRTVLVPARLLLTIIPTSLDTSITMYVDSIMLHTPCDMFWPRGSHSPTAWSTPCLNRSLPVPRKRVIWFKTWSEVPCVVKLSIMRESSDAFASHVVCGMKQQRILKTTMEGKTKRSIA